MPSIKLLNGLSHDLVQSYISTLCYYKKGYMLDWIFNGAKHLGITEVEINIFTEQIKPSEMEIPPLKAYLSKLRTIISNTLKNNKFNDDQIQSAFLQFKIEEFQSGYLYCKAIVKDINGKEYFSNEIYEKAYEPYFNAFEEINQGRRKNIFDWIKKFLG